MPRKTITIESIFEGKSPSIYFAEPQQYSASVGIDPDLPISDAVGDRETAGQLRPSGYTDFTGANVNANPFWILTNPKDELVYLHLSNGRIVSYTSALASETLVGTVPSTNGNGAAYYNNFLYFMANTDVSRYGPLDGVPVLSNSVWTGATLGSQTALGNQGYASLRGSGTYPNHVAHVHVDNKLYFGDFITAAEDDKGKGIINFIKTNRGTDEGDTNDGSTRNALDLPFGYLPTAIASYGNLLAIGAVQTIDSTLKQGRAGLFLWDTISPSFNQFVELPDSLVTAIRNINGRLYVFTGSASNGTDVSNGYRVSIYAGGNRVEQVYYSNNGMSPLAGAVAGIGDRVCWGTFEQMPSTTPASPDYFPCVMAIGSKDNRFPSGVHGIINSTATGEASDGVVTALETVQQDSFSYPKFIVGHRDSGGNGADAQSTTYGTVRWRSQMFKPNKRFTIKKIELRLATPVAVNMTITPKIFFDNYTSSSVDGLTVINNTNYPNSEEFIHYSPNISGNNNFVLEFEWSGTALLPILLPIKIDIDIHDLD